MDSRRCGCPLFMRPRPKIAPSYGDEFLARRFLAVSEMPSLSASHRLIFALVFPAALPAALLNHLTPADADAYPSHHLT